MNAFYSNPRTHFRFTLNGYLGLLEAVFTSCCRSTMERIPADLPLLVISGEEDPVGGMGQGVRRFAAMLEDCGMRDLRCELIPGDRHEILNETDREETFQKLLGWMEERLGQAQS